MIDYDPKIIQDYAEGLYKQARSIVSCYFFMGMAVGLIVFAKISDLLIGELDFVIMAIGVLTGSVIGIFAGKNRAFEMRLNAQQALCQVTIEKNTKK